MNILFVVSHRRDWPFDVAGVRVIPARLYLTDPHYSNLPDTRVFNLCNSCRYQSRGYYVSMLAEARGHQPLPDVQAIEDLHSDDLFGPLARSLGPQYQESLSAVAADNIRIPIWFGRTDEPSFGLLGEQLFNLFHLPLMEACFERRGEQWRLSEIRQLALSDLDANCMQAVRRAAEDCFRGHRQRIREPAASKPVLAILRTPDGQASPSNAAAISKFQEAAEALDMHSKVITRDQASRLSDYDGLLIRDTTNVNDCTYQLARQAAVAGLVVVDDPDSIVRCSNKVFLNELLSRHQIPMPKTLLVHRDNLDQVIPTLGLPCILKQPDSAFSVGVVKIESPQQLSDTASALFDNSALLLAQEFLPTDFDWRIGIFDRKPLFVCRYHMAPGHWQIIKREGDSRYSEGLAEAIPLQDAPDEVIRVALAAANLIGDGFYGVDLKQRGNQLYIIEINDNPNVDAGNEDGVLHDALYRNIVGVMRSRIEARKGSIG